MLRRIFGTLAAAFWLLISAVTGPQAAAAATKTAYFANVGGPGEDALYLYVEETGHGTPVVLIHGLGGSTYSWRFIAPVLARSHRVIALDLKGFGRSSKVFDTGYSAFDQARLLSRFLARRRLTGTTVIGHSFGGQVALMTALRRDSGWRIARMTLIDVPALPQRLSPVVEFMRQPVLPYILMTAVPSDILTALSLNLPTRQRYARGYTADDTEAYAAPLHDAAARHAYIQTARQIVPQSLPAIVERYRTLRQPTLLVWCGGDEIVPVATGRALARILPNAELKTLPGCNHSPLDESPRALAGLLAAALNR